MIDRDIGQEILDGIREIKADKKGGRQLVRRELKEPSLPDAEKLDEHDKKMKVLRQALTKGESSGDAGPLDREKIRAAAKRKAQASVHLHDSFL